jgi:predicted TIM-barrel fold metal-dependent hydrolase
VEFYRIYNDWLADFCAHDRKRLVGLASIPAHSVEAAVAETKHAARLGLGGLDVSISFEMEALWSPSWDPFWAAAQEADLAVHFHTIVVPPARPLPADAPEASRLSARATELALFQVHLAGILSSIIHGGALERFPKLRIVLGESGIGWIPYVLDRMDNQWEGRFRKRMSLTMKPSDYWRRQCRATFQDDVVGTRLLDLLGEENVMWGSDYPHPDGVFPDSQEHIRKQFGHLPEATRRRITCENVAKFYKLM